MQKAYHKKQRDQKQMFEHLFEHLFEQDFTKNGQQPHPVPSPKREGRKRNRRGKMADRMEAAATSGWGKGSRRLCDIRHW